MHNNPLSMEGEQSNNSSSLSNISTTDLERGSSTMQPQTTMPHDPSTKRASRQLWKANNKQHGMLAGQQDRREVLSKNKKAIAKNMLLWAGFQEASDVGRTGASAHQQHSRVISIVWEQQAEPHFGPWSYETKINAFHPRRGVYEPSLLTQLKCPQAIL